MVTSQLLRRRALVFGAIGCLLLASCLEGGRRLPETGATLEGTVTYAGQKVPVALVIAQGKDGSANGFVGEDGRYRLSNVPLGEVNLAVNTEAGKAEMTGRLMARSQGKSAVLPKVVDVPHKYAELETSGLKTTIQKGPNTYDIVIPK